jgi:U3 small nucleolar RNA-associated protein 18
VLAVPSAGVEEKITAADAEEIALEQQLFGALGTFEVLKQMGSENDGADWMRDDPRGDVGSIPRALPFVKPTAHKRSRAWIDDDDERLAVNLSKVNRLRKLRDTMSETQVTGHDYTERLRGQHMRIHKNTSWASSTSAGLVAGGDGHDAPSVELSRLSRQADYRVSMGVGTIPSDVLGVKRRTDANKASKSQAVVQSVEFHRNAQLMLTAGFDQTLRLFAVDGNRNPLVQSVFVKDMPIHTASFTADGRSVVMSGRRKYFYTYDLERATVSRVPRIFGRDEKSLEKFVLSPDNKWIAFLGALLANHIYTGFSYN